MTRTTRSGPANDQMVPSFAESQKKILAWIQKIPRGQVASYGQIAELAGIARGARLTARCLRGNNDPTLPWWRVIRSDGSCAVPNQLTLLASEGVAIKGGRVQLRLARWQALDLLIFAPDG